MSPTPWVVYGNESLSSEALASEVNRDMQAACTRFWHDTPSERSAAMALLRKFMRAVTSMERMGRPSEAIKHALAPAREAFATAVLAHRCQQWERGYAGDFQTIEHLVGARNLSAPGTIGWHFEQILLEFSATPHHRNKLERQSVEFVRVIQRRPGARILSLACGGGLDWVPVLPLLAEFTGEIVLHDCEPAALESAESRLRAATSMYRLVAGNVLRVASRLSAEPRFDLIAAGGLFDYLTDKAIVSVLRVIRSLLAPGGRLFFTNIAKGNEWRPLMEYGLNWRIVERTSEQIEGLCRNAGFGTSEVAISREATGVTFLVNVDRTI
jgi:extracellular factor (EF) 3-hydroxypalmitic acid methyl ester biosynthesis protein